MHKSDRALPVNIDRKKRVRRSPQVLSMLIVAREARVSLGQVCVIRSGSAH
jgi:hypothetical protein